MFDGRKKKREVQATVEDLEVKPRRSARLGGRSSDRGDRGVFCEGIDHVCSVVEEERVETQAEQALRRSRRRRGGE